jgi:ABC-2 type transport system ATP-binding protein
VFGLLGPNGAGKTTTVEILEGLRARTAGQVRVLGFDPGTQVKELKQRIGVCLQATNLPGKLKVYEALEWFAAFYERNADRDKLLERLQLEEKRNEFFQSLSGGQKQRVALALALVNDPHILFLDEPTTGLDPQVRQEIHGLVREVRDQGKTVVLTTHYLEEAEKLCDEIAIVDHGKIIERGTPREIQQRTLGHSRIEVKTEHAVPPDGPPGFEGAEKVLLSEDRRELTLYSPVPARTLTDVVKWIDQKGLGLEDIHLKRPTLEDVFIELTGRKLRE